MKTSDLLPSAQSADLRAAAPTFGLPSTPQPSFPRHTCWLPACLYVLGETCGFPHPATAEPPQVPELGPGGQEVLGYFSTPSRESVGGGKDPDSDEGIPCSWRSRSGMEPGHGRGLKDYSAG